MTWFYCNVTQLTSSRTELDTQRKKCGFYPPVAKLRLWTKPWNVPWGLNFTSEFANTALKVWLHGGGVPQIGEVTRLGGVTRLSI